MSYKYDSQEYEFEHCSCFMFDTRYMEDEGQIPDELWGVDLDLDIWLRVGVLVNHSFVRGSGKLEPQWFEIESINVIESTGDPDSLHLSMAEDYFWPAKEDERWPSQVPLDHKDIPFPTWLGAHEEEFVSMVLTILDHKREAAQRAFSCVYELAKEVGGKALEEYDFA